MRKKSLCTSLILAVALAVVPPLALPLRAETPSREFSDETVVDEVLLDVLVTDKKGRVVLGLGKDDFVVRENGEPMEINSVAFYSNRRFLGDPGVASAIGVDPDTVPVDRYFVLFFHRQNHLLPRLGANLMNAGHRAKQWVRGDLLPNDYVAVAAYDTHLEIQGFTNDPAAITGAIDEAIRGKDFSPRDLAAPAELPALAESLPEGDADRIYDALRMTAEAVGAVRGRKNLVLYSIGFGELDAFGFYLPDMRYYPDTIAALNDNNVAVYPVDLLAGDLSPVFHGSILDTVLWRLADETGGRFFHNAVNFLTPLEKISEDNNGYYLLSYTTRRAADDGYQEVDVETRNPKLRARAREGYLPGAGS